MRGSVPPDLPASGDEYAKDSTDASATNPGKTADDRRNELRGQEVIDANVRMRHTPTGEVTTYNREQLKAERLFVPALREDFPRDQFEEFKERAS